MNGAVSSSAVAEIRKHINNGLSLSFGVWITHLWPDLLKLNCCWVASLLLYNRLMCIGSYLELKDCTRLASSSEANTFLQNFIIIKPSYKMSNVSQMEKCALYLDIYTVSVNVPVLHG